MFNTVKIVLQIMKIHIYGNTELLITNHVYLNI